MTLSRTPSLAGSSGGDSPSLTGWGIAADQAHQELEQMKPFEVLRQTSEQFDSAAIPIPEEARKTFYLGMGAYIENDVHGLWYEPSDNHDGHTPDALAVTIGQRFSELTTFYNGAATGSPIEDMMAGALLWIYAEWAGMPKADFLNGPDDWREQKMLDQDLVFVLTSQAKVAGHKADFLLWFARGRHVAGVAIECDGHAFHEKTKEQAARDKRRDREILTAGFPVLRFSGSEIYRDVLACVEQVRDALDSPLHRVSKDSGLY